MSGAWATPTQSLLWEESGQGILLAPWNGPLKFIQKLLVSPDCQQSPWSPLNSW